MVFCHCFFALLAPNSVGERWFLLRILMLLNSHLWRQGTQLSKNTARLTGSVQLLQDDYLVVSVVTLPLLSPGLSSS